MVRMVEEGFLVAITLVFLCYWGFYFPYFLFHKLLYNVHDLHLAKLVVFYFVNAVFWPDTRTLW